MTRIEQMTMDAIQSIDRKMKDQHDIDWEQRRYEIAKEMMPYCARVLIDVLNSGGKNEEWVGKTANQVVAEASVSYADALIAEFKKEIDV